MSILTDMFGSIAYREALKGGEGINTPHIDSQQEVYTAMLEELELANSLYNASLGLDDPTKDGIYGGDIAKWQKFTNTLRLRPLMRGSRPAVTTPSPPRSASRSTRSSPTRVNTPSSSRTTTTPP